MVKEKFRYYFLKISLIILVVFIFQILFQGFTDFFVLDNRAFLLSQYWRYLSAIFLHASLTHLLYNLFALIFFGLALERIAGSKNFLIIFLGSGLIANMIALNFYPKSLGASGAIYGVIGALTVLRPFMLVWAFGIFMPMIVASILWIVGDIFGIFFPSDVGSIAHLAGIFIGFLFGFVLRILNKKRIKIKKEKLVFPEEKIRTWEDLYIK